MRGARGCGAWLGPTDSRLWRKAEKVGVLARYPSGTPAYYRIRKTAKLREWPTAQRDRPTNSDDTVRWFVLHA